MGDVAAMDFGIFLAAQHARGSMADHLDEHLEQVRTAREVGFRSVFAGQHYFSNPYQMLHPVPLLARVAAEAGDMRVGTGILLAPLFNPVEIAELATTMDAICRGRFVLGLGLGYRDEEFDAFGVPPRRRIAYLEEALTLIPRLWTESDVEYESERVRLRGATFPTRPTARPHPPIWVAANNDRAVERAARLGDAWLINPHAKLSVLKRQMGVYRRARAEAGRPPPAVVPMNKEVYCAETAEEAWRDARPFLEEKYRVYVDWGQQRVLPPGDDLDLPFEQLQGERFIVGDPDQVIAQLERYRQELGVTHAVLRLQWPGLRGSLDQAKVLRSMRLIGRHVIPHFRGEGERA
jgi:alkanesulfonate monooxygenase SsuD/methylene tetrahydromethanopterin reductase-like flavin-dependent oxidoreductase (luciferase family)